MRATFWIAWRNLMHDRARFGVALAGVGFAMLLILAQSGIFAGFKASASVVIDHCSADFWIVSAGCVNFESAQTFSEDSLQVIRGVPGIERVDRLVHVFGYVKLPTGRGTWAHVVGINPVSGIGGPWEMTAGRVDDLRKEGTYIADASGLGQLAGVRPGTRLENSGRRMDVVGLSRGARTNTTYPLFFTSLRTAQQMPGLEGGMTFLVATLAPGADRAAALERLRRLERFDVYTREEFSGMTRTYWATKTGVGIAIGLTMALGFVVGLVIVGQTMYASTVERLMEFGTLKALGAGNRQVCSIIWTQALLIGAGGGAAGLAAALLLERCYSGQTVAMELSAPLCAAAFGTVLVMCLGASLLSVSRILRLSPAVVFRS